MGQVFWNYQCYLSGIYNINHNTGLIVCKQLWHYRSIAILDAIPKLFESIIKDRMYNASKYFFMDEEHGLSVPISVSIPSTFLVI